mmetsp:Transcript_93542/g.166404  ORF Transcript_93542/g.166404 Transcript_93542/m.166404 type:complete len:571 (-) Transcript_93542:80-1792(-)
MAAATADSELEALTPGELTGLWPQSAEPKVTEARQASNVLDLQAAVQASGPSGSPRQRPTTTPLSSTPQSQTAQLPPSPISAPGWQQWQQPGQALPWQQWQQWQQPWQQQPQQQTPLLPAQALPTPSPGLAGELAGQHFRSLEELEEAFKSRSRGGSLDDEDPDEAWQQALDLKQSSQKASKPPPPPPPPPPPSADGTRVQGPLTMQTGTVRRLFPGKGFGFVARDDGGRGARHGRGDVFLHFSDLEPGVGSAELAVGARVRFHWEETADPQRGPGGRARRVSLTDVPDQPAAIGAMGGNMSDDHSPPSTPTSNDPSAVPTINSPIVGPLPGAAVPAMPGVTTAAAPASPSVSSAAYPTSAATPGVIATPAPRPRAAGRVYRREHLLAAESVLRRWGQLRGPRQRGIPRTLRLPSYCWDDDENGSEDEELTDDEARLRALEARLDRENGADDRNVETFGEAWEGDGWTFEEALAANERLQGTSTGVPSQYPYGESSSSSPLKPGEATVQDTDGRLKMAPKVTEFSAVDSILVSTTSSEDGDEAWAAATAAAGAAAAGGNVVRLDPNLVLQ